MVNIEDLVDNLDTWLEEQRLNSELSQKTISKYKSSIHKFINFNSSNDIKNINKQVMLNYRDYLDEQSSSVKSKNLWIIVLNKYLKYLNLNNLCLKQIKTQKNFVIYKKMSVTDLQRLLRIAKREKRMQDYWIIMTLARTGIRISELKYFTVENLKKENKNTFHYKSKGKERDVVVPKSLAMDLRKYAREQKIKSGPLFHQIKDASKPINPATVWKHLKKIAGIARVNKEVVHAHSFRHLFATVFCRNNPGNNILLADLLGHSSLETTRIYTELSIDEKQSILEDMKFR